MNIRNFQLSELDFSLNDVARLMSYEEEMPPEISAVYQAEHQQFLGLKNIIGCYKVFPCTLNKSEYSITVEGITFKLGKSLFLLLKDATHVAVFLCTAGETISHRAKELMDAGEFLEGYTIDVYGSVVVEKAMDVLHKECKLEFAKQGMGASNRYSPGYCDWNVEEQHKLFSLFSENKCGISLNDSALMSPIKSVSGFIGLGENVKFHAYTCELCTQQNCIYTKKK